MSGRAEVRRVSKPWGYEVIWAHTDRYVGKILHIDAGQALSVQYHEVKDETVVGNRPAILPRVTGRAWIYGLSQIGLDPTDPFPRGFALSDAWGPYVGEL